MKKLLLLLIFSSRLSFAQQSGWYWVNPLPQGNDLQSLQFINSNTAFCISPTHIFKTENKCIDWKQYPTYENQHNQSLYFSDDKIGYVLCDSGRVLKTTNTGTNWFPMSDLQTRACRSIYFSDNYTGFVISFNSTYDHSGTKLFSTTNGGFSWEIIYSDTVITLTAIDFPQHDTGYAVGNYYKSPYNYLKLFRTTNAGARWDSIGQNIKLLVSGCYFHNTSTGYIYGQSNNPRGIYKTTNGGMNWLGDSLTFSSVTGLHYFDSNNAIAVANNSYFERTTNGGTTWQNAGYDVELYNSILSFHFSDPANGFFVGQGGKMMRSTNGGFNWTYLSNGQHREIWSIRMLGRTGYASGEHMLLKSTDEGMSWFKLINDSASVFTYYGMDFINEETGFVGGLNAIKRTTNGGLNWTIAPVVGWWTDIFDINFPTTNTGYAFGGLFYKTTNSGATWFRINSPRYPFSTYFSRLFFLNEQTGFCIGGLAEFGAVSKTTDGGNTWDTTMTFNSAWLNDAYFTNSETGYAAGFSATQRGAILKSTDGGKSWVVKFEFDKSFFNSIKFVNEQTGYACSYNGHIAKTIDAGESWSISQSPSFKALNNICFVNPDTGFVAGDGGTILMTTNGGRIIESVPPTADFPVTFGLHQNYPNPFNPGTTIKVDVPLTDPVVTREVRIFVYDIVGRLVAIVAEGSYLPGTYEFHWDASNFASGVYFYQIKAGDFVQTKKMVLLK